MGGWMDRWVVEPGYGLLTAIKKDATFDWNKDFTLSRVLISTGAAEDFLFSPKAWKKNTHGQKNWLEINVA